MRKLTLEEKNQRIQLTNPDIEIIDEIDGKLKCKCLIDGYEWYSYWNNLQKTLYCIQCKNKISRENKFKKYKQRLKTISPNIEILSDSSDYINNKSKLKCRCLIDEYEWQTTWEGLSQGKGCSKCSGTAKLNIEEIKNRLKEINPNIEILSNEYINSNTKLKCKCLIDGCEWDVSWNSLSNGNGCPKCHRTKLANLLKLDINVVKDRIKTINPNIKILTNIYNGASDKVKCKCLIDDYEWETKWISLLTGRGCHECGGQRRDYDISILSEKLKTINPNIKILSKMYVGSTDKLRCQCLIHNVEWNVSWERLYIGAKCPKCRKISKAEKQIAEALDKMHIHYIREYTFDDLIGLKGGLLRFDFGILNDNNLVCLIEYDGEFHYKQCYEKHDVDKQQKYDNLKNEYCIKNNIPLIRIPYWEKDNISEILTDIFICENTESKFIVK